MLRNLLESLRGWIMPLLEYVWNCPPGEEPHKASMQLNFLLLILSCVTVVTVLIGSR